MDDQSFGAPLIEQGSEPLGHGRAVEHAALEGHGRHREAVAQNWLQPGVDATKDEVIDGDAALLGERNELLNRNEVATRSHPFGARRRISESRMAHEGFELVLVFWRKRDPLFGPLQERRQVKQLIQCHGQDRRERRQMHLPGTVFRYPATERADELKQRDREWKHL